MSAAWRHTRAMDKHNCGWRWRRRCLTFPVYEGSKLACVTLSGEMIKTILVPTSGSSSDESVFATALALARVMLAHLEFYHLRLTASEAAVRSPHVQY
jgi:hypothetical protein